MKPENKMVLSGIGAFAMLIGAAYGFGILLWRLAGVLA